MVILLMTARTVSFGSRKLIAYMATLARHHTVEAHQREVGEVMVEAIDGLPAVRDMTGGAHLHVRVLVNVIRRVTGGAVPRQIILQSTNVTVGAGQRLVMTRQRKAGLGGVVKLGVLPGLGGVARLTLFAVAPQMNVTIGMAAMASGRQVFLHHTIGVAGATGQVCVAVSQGEIRGVVVEHTLVPPVHRVAAIALLAVFTRMHIRRLMAAHAGGFFKLIALAGVTATTSHFCMETA